MPILSTLIVLQILNVWNEFIWPIMVLSRPERYPAVLAILRLNTLITGATPELSGICYCGPAILLMFAFHQPLVHSGADIRCNQDVGVVSRRNLIIARSWYATSYRKLFFGFHSHNSAAGLAADFDAEAWADRLVEG